RGGDRSPSQDLAGARNRWAGGKAAFAQALPGSIVQEDGQFALRFGQGNRLAKDGAQVAPIARRKRLLANQGLISWLGTAAEGLNFGDPILVGRAIGENAGARGDRLRGLRDGRWCG